MVHSRAVGDGRTALRYLAPYVFRVAISDHRIVSDSDGRVTFSYRPSGPQRWRRMTVDGREFLRRFLQHVLPSGFQKVRHFGFRAPHSRLSVEAVRWRVTLHHGEVFTRLAKLAVTPAAKPRPPAPDGPQDEPREIGQRIRRDGFADLKLFRSAGTIFFAPSPVESEDLSCVNLVSRCVLPSVGPAVVAGWHFECLHELRWGRFG